MRLPFGVLAFVLGVVGFAAIEIGGTTTGAITGMTRSVLLDAVAYGVGTLLVAALLAPLLRGAGVLAFVGVALLFLVLYVPAVALVAGIAELTLTGTWGVEGLVRSAFITTPINLMLTFVLELPFIAVPLGVAVVVVLWRVARASARVPRTVRRRGQGASSTT